MHEATTYILLKIFFDLKDPFLCFICARFESTATFECTGTSDRFVRILLKKKRRIFIVERKYNGCGRCGR